MKIDRSTLLILVAGFVIGWWLASGGDTRKPTVPLADRPVLRWVVKTAKTLLWVAVFVEPAPPEEPEHARTVKAQVGDDGFVRLDHGRGW